MSNELATRDLTAQKDFAIALAQSDLLPRAYAGKPANVLVAMEWAHALGVAPLVAMQQLYIIDGKPTASAQMISGLVRRAGHNLRVSGDDAQATCEITRSDDPDFVFRSVWTMDRARQAGLAGKGTWKQYPAALLKARAITEAARDACPEALLGVSYTPEELGAEDRAPRDMRPTPQPSPPAPEPVADEDGVIVDAEIVEDSHPDLGEPIHPVTREYPTPADDDPYRAPVTQTDAPKVRRPDDTASQAQLGKIRGLCQTLGVGAIKAGDFAHWIVNQQPGSNLPDGYLLTKGDASHVIGRLEAEGKALAAEFLGTLT